MFPLVTAEHLLWEVFFQPCGYHQGWEVTSPGEWKDTIIFSQEEGHQPSWPPTTLTWPLSNKNSPKWEFCGTLSLNLPRSKLTGDEGFSAITSFFHLSPSRMGPDPAGPPPAWTEGIHIEVCPFSDTGGPHLIGIKGRAATLS